MRLLNQKCQISRVTITKDEYKHTTKSWVVIGTGRPCNIQYQTIVSNNVNQSETGLITTGLYLGFFDSNENIMDKDKILWSGINLFVRGIPSPVFRGNKIHHLEVLLSVEES